MFIVYVGAKCLEIKLECAAQFPDIRLECKIPVVVAFNPLIGTANFQVRQLVSPGEVTAEVIFGKQQARWMKMFGKSTVLKIPVVIG